MPRFIDLTGRRFGRLVVLRRANIGTLKPHWVCACDCGRTHTTGGSDLKLGKAKSCGCLTRDTTRTRNFKHGGAPRSGLAPEYIVWNNMNRRCHDPKTEGYPLYGGRGIHVCEEWRTSYAAFLRDMGSRPFAGATLDRIDPDLHYEPSNCRWATAREQANNKRNTLRVMYGGRRVSIPDLARQTNCGHAALWRRITKEGQAPEDAVAALQASTRRKHR